MKVEVVDSVGEVVEVDVDAGGGLGDAVVGGSVVGLGVGVPEITLAYDDILINICEMVST